MKVQQRHGRRGFVFPVRITEEQREQLEARKFQVGGPRVPKHLRGEGT